MFTCQLATVCHCALLYVLPLNHSCVIYPDPIPGGYSYRLCPAAPAGDINEACFQTHQLDFAGTTSDILYSNGTRITIPLTTTTIGTFPKGSQWAKNPIPGCYMCDAYQTCGATLAPVSGIPSEDPCSACETEANCKTTNATFNTKCNWGRKGNTMKCQPPPDACKGPATQASCEAKKDTDGHECQWITVGSDHGHCRTNAAMSPALLWDQQINCRADCDGGLVSKALGSCPEGTAIFPEPVPGLSGWGKGGWKWSIADKVRVPSDLKPGPYLLSWRWDCEGGRSALECLHFSHRCVRHIPILPVFFWGVLHTDKRVYRHSHPSPLPPPPPSLCEESVQVWQNCADVLLV